MECVCCYYCLFIFIIRFVLWKVAAAGAVAPGLRPRLGLRVRRCRSRRPNLRLRRCRSRRLRRCHQRHQSHQKSLRLVVVVSMKSMQRLSGGLNFAQTRSYNSGSSCGRETAAIGRARAITTTKQSIQSFQTQRRALAHGRGRLTRPIRRINIKLWILSRIV